MVSVDELTVGDHGHVFCPDGRPVYIERGGDWWTPLTPQGSFSNMRPMLRDDLARLLRPAKEDDDPKSKSDLWIVWSDRLQCWAPTAWSFEHNAAHRHASRYNNGGVGGVHDWRPVRIPPPSQIEATAELLAALKLVRYPLELEEAIREYESNVAHAAIAKANGESAS